MSLKPVTNKVVNFSDFMQSNPQECVKVKVYPDPDNLKNKYSYLQLTYRKKSNAFRKMLFRAAVKIGSTRIKPTKTDFKEK